MIYRSRVAEVTRGYGGPPPKSLDSDENFFPLSVRPCVTGVTSHISHIYKGLNAMLILILAIFLAKTRPDKTIFCTLTNLTIDFD